MISRLKTIASREWFLLFAGALAVRVIVVAATGFDGLYGQDAYAYFDQAMALRTGILHGILAPNDFFWPQGYPLMAAMVSLIIGSGPLAAQLVSLVAGAAAAPLTFLIAQRLLPRENRSASILAGLFVAVGAQAVISSIVIMSDAAALALLLAAMWIVLKFHKHPRNLGHLGLAVLFGAAAAATRWASLLVGPALALPALQGLDTGGGRSRRFVFLVGGGTFALMGTILVATLKLDAISGYFERWSLINLLHGPIAEIPSQALSAKVPGLIFYLAPIYHPAFLGPLLGGLALLGLWKAGSASSRLSVTLLIVWIAVPTIFCAGLPLRNLRFCLLTLVPWSIAAAWGASALATTLLRRRIIVLLVGFSCMANAGWGVHRIDRLTSNQENLIKTVRAVEELIPPDGIVLTFEITQLMQHHSRVETLELFDQTPASMERLLADHRPLFVLIQPLDIEERWQDLPPGQNIRELQRHGRLVETGHFGPYTLSRFKPLSSAPERP